ncbi:carboxymuconolactone decarboxylase family protein [Chengkuizengella sediminis]|uniref:carboxymuconolactone decarboxylase family protein n=1 Tax=Chengkuizengella sediminis TaxID=1885917 RepID=UPI00138A5D4E|nr:carboxymuconolactone decarboxylase family protein [Chengkuizengella sediminis]NDI35814.1 carboxymuconolactone decarboxylase family protein [Chengkuizengella sediminis]
MSFDKGISNIKEIAGTDGIHAVEAIQDLHPDIHKYVVQFGFGEIYSRSELDRKQQEMITITCLITLGDTADQLRFHFKAALNIGITPQEIFGIVIHCIPYVGFPRVLNALQIAKEVIDEASKL